MHEALLGHTRPPPTDDAPQVERLRTLLRFALYGLLGWSLEVAFTGTVSALRGDPATTATTYLWMLPIYGGAALALERTKAFLVHRAARLPVRLACYVLVIYAAEYASGAALTQVLGRCPWDYGDAGLAVHGLVRLDYLPLWIGVAAAFDGAQGHVRGAAGAVVAGARGPLASLASLTPRPRHLRLSPPARRTCARRRAHRAPRRGAPAAHRSANRPGRPISGTRRPSRSPWRQSRHMSCEIPHQRRARGRPRRRTENTTEADNAWRVR